MSWIQITDNKRSKLTELGANESDKENIKKIANVAIAELSLDDNPNLLVFPRDLNRYDDEISENHILSLSEDEISTGNIMGFVGVKDTQLNIKSRFAKDCSEDYFLHYMLQKVFAINLFDIPHTTSEEPIFDFLLYLFPHFLKKALAQGLFKKYRRYEYNDANVRGSVDVNRHIRQNVPFKGTVAYSAREHSYDNEVTQLIRHTIEYLRSKEQGATILNNDLETKVCISQITMATQTYNLRDRNKVITQNLRPLRHPYYSAYTDLQKICMQILRHESIKYGYEKDKIYGILFDGAWLWEEYLNTILRPLGFNHPENKKQKGGFHIFKSDTDSKNCRRLFPDFWKENFILDAKYKHLNRGIGREDLYQVVTYMYCKKANHGGYVYPDEGNNSYSNQLEGYNGYIHLLPISIPQNQPSHSTFMNKMQESEKTFKEALSRVHP